MPPSSESAEPAFLFGFSDAPVMKALNLYREETGKGFNGQ